MFPRFLVFSKVKIVAGDGLVTNHRPEITAQVGYSIVAGHRGHHQTEEVTHAYSITSLTVGGRILLRVMAGEKDTIIILCTSKKYTLFSPHVPVVCY